MKKNLLAIAIWAVAGPTAAVKSLEITQSIESRRNRKRRRAVQQPRFTDEEFARAKILLQEAFNH
jgi:hypothetical protein